MMGPPPHFWMAFVGMPFLAAGLARLTAVAQAIKEGLAGEGEAEAVACPHCGEDNRPGAAYCHHCDQALARSCPGCGATNQPDASFCDRCERRLREP